MIGQLELVLVLLMMSQALSLSATFTFPIDFRPSTTFTLSSGFQVSEDVSGRFIAKASLQLSSLQEVINFIEGNFIEG